MKVQDGNLQARLVLAGGDEYELAFTAPQTSRGELAALADELKLALSRVGSTKSGIAGLQVLDAQGRPMDLQRGFDHFAP
jgi:thiamine-monophosphate kinase